MKDKIESLILDQFVATGARVGHCIDERWVLHKLVPSLSPKEQLEVEAVISDLERRELITVSQRMGMRVMALAEKGYDAIYPSDPAAAKEKIKLAILSRFSSTSSKVGHCVDERWITQQLIRSLNPEERNELDSAIEEMVSDGFITTDTRLRMTVLVLTQKGFDAIY